MSIYELVTKDEAGRILIGTIANEACGAKWFTIAKVDGTSIGDEAPHMSDDDLRQGLASGDLMVLINTDTLEDYGFENVTQVDEYNFIYLLEKAPGTLAQVVLDFWSSMQDEDWDPDDLQVTTWIRPRT